MPSIKPSIQSEIFKMVLKLIRFKTLIEKRVLKEQPHSNRKFVPRYIEKKLLTNTFCISNRGIATIENENISSPHHIIFFHGGAYVFGATSNHWRLARKIIKKYPCRITMIDYPLAPENQYTDAFIMVQSAYEKLTEYYPSDKFILMGDSAGGGLAMAFCQKLIKDHHEKPPIGIILLSPWLDLTMSNPEIKKQENKDQIMTIRMLKTAGNKYAGNANQKEYLLSPINGELIGLPPTIVFCGTDELFYPDCIKLRSLVKDKGNFTFKEYSGMQHDWAIFPIPEQDMVVDDIVSFISDNL